MSWLLRLYGRWRDRHDPALAAYRFASVRTTAATYDFEKAVRARKRADQRQRSRTKLEAAQAKPRAEKVPSHVTSFAKRERQ